MLTLKRAKDVSRNGEVLFATNVSAFFQNDYDKVSFATAKGIQMNFAI